MSCGLLDFSLNQNIFSIEKIDVSKYDVATEPCIFILFKRTSPFKLKRFYGPFRGFQ